MVNIRPDGTGGSGGGTSGGDSSSDSDGGFTEEQRDLLRETVDTSTTTDTSGGSRGKTTTKKTTTTTDPFEGAQTGSDVFEQGQTIDTTQETTSTDSGQATDASGQQETGTTDATRRRQVRRHIGGGIEAVRQDPGRPEPEASPETRQMARAVERTPEGADRPSTTEQVFREKATENAKRGVGTPGGAPTLGDVGESLVDDPITSVSRGGTASEFGRNVAAGALDVGYQDPEELGTGIDVEGRTGGFDVSGPGAVNADPTAGDVFASGEGGELDTEITDRLTRGRGLFSDEGDASGFFAETEESLRGTVEQRQETFGVGEELAGITPDVEIFDGVTTSDVAEGVGRVPGDVAAAPSSILLGADLATETAANLPGTVEEFGAGPTAGAIFETGGRATGGLVTAAEERPGQFAGSLAGGLVAGFGAGRALQGAPNVARSASIRARGGEIFDFEELSDPPTQTEGFGLPGFTREAQADPEVAAREFTEQAEANVLAGESPVAFHGRDPESVSEFGGFGSTFEAPEGSAEIPGLYQSADLSNLRVGGGGGSGGLSIGLPRPQVRGSRILAEEDVDVDVAPGRDRFEVGEFLTGEADRGKSFIRGGDVTPEQEAIAPPGSVFEESGGVFGVRVGGRSLPFTDRTFGGSIATGRLTRRGEPDAESGGGEALTQVEMAEETTRAISETVRGEARQPDAPFAPVPVGVNGTATGTATATETQRTGVFGEPVSGSTTGTSGVSGGGEAADLFGLPTRPSGGGGTSTGGRDTGGPTGGGVFGTGTTTGTGTGSTTRPDATSIFGGPSSGGPTGPGGSSGPFGGPSGSSAPPSGPPSSPPSGPPSSSSGSPPPGPPSTGPPSSPPFLPGVPGSPGTPRPLVPDRDTDDEDDDPFGIGPAGSEFENPVASGGEFLFGGGAFDFGIGTQRGSEPDLVPTGFGTPFEDDGNGVPDVFGFFE